MLKNSQKSGGLIDSGWGPDPDTTGAAIAALAPYYNSKPDAKTFVDKAIAGLAAAQGTSGSLGSANSDAMAIIGLAAMGINPHTDSRFIKNTKSLLDGLLSYALADKSGFGYDNNTSLNALATEQGFRALIAAYKVMDTGAAYNVHDFSSKPAQSARATADAEPPSVPPTGTGSDITVTFTIKSDTGYWLNAKPVTVKSGSVVYHAFMAAIDGTGISAVGAESNYVRSITNNGVTLAEFGKGQNSGWLYKVNGTLPVVGILSYSINDGDNILFYYTEDWTKDPDAGSVGGGGGGAPEAPPVTTEVKPDVTVDDTGKATSEVKTNDVKNALDEIKKGLDENPESAGELKITANSETGANTVDVKLIVEAANAVADAGVQLTIDTGVSTVSFDAEAIKAATDGANGNHEIVLTTELVSNDTLTDEQRELVGDNPVFDLTLTVDGNNITDFGAGTVTVTLPYTPKAGEDTSNLTVYYLRDDGTVVEMTGAKYDPESGGIIFTTSHFSKFFVGTASAWVNPFKDVKAADWFYGAVRYICENGLMNGTAADMFSPESPMTRAMLVTVLYRYEGEPAVKAANPFSDVSEGQWYTKAIIWASENGIVEGLGGGLFGTNNDITREQIATILYRYAEKKGLNVGKTTDLSAYADASRISGWAQSAMVWANAEGLITGRTATTLAPQDTAKRAEVATVLMRCIEDFVK